MICVCRFFQNPSYDPENPHSNRLISRTLGKIAFINASTGSAGAGRPMPQDDEFWFSDIVAETDSGQPRGCFLVEPFEKLERDQLVPVTTNSCTVSLVYGSVVVIDPVETITPEGKTIPWIVPLKRKAALLTCDVVGVVANCGGKWWIRR